MDTYSEENEKDHKLKKEDTTLDEVVIATEEIEVKEINQQR